MKNNVAIDIVLGEYRYNEFICTVRNGGTKIFRCFSTAEACSLSLARRCRELKVCALKGVTLLVFCGSSTTAFSPAPWIYSACLSMLTCLRLNDGSTGGSYLGKCHALFKGRKWAVV